jgi:hypothetical protein
VIETDGDALGAKVEFVVAMEVFGCLETASGGVCYLVTCSVRMTTS